MKRIRISVVLLLAVSPALAAAATPGLNLGWSNCATTAAAGNKSYLCDGQFGAPFAIQGTFRPAVSVPDLSMCSSWLELGFDGAIPDYWATDDGSCNAGAITIANPRSTAPCVTTNIFDPSYCGGGYLRETLSSNHVRVRIDWASGAPVPPKLSAGLLYPAFRLEFDPDSGIQNECAGCSEPVCFLFSRLEVFGFLPEEQYEILTPDARAWCTWQGGSGAILCPSEVPTRNATWGAIKALYR